METHYYVDIHAGPGITLRADACLRLAEQHGARGVVAHLLPYTVHGPGYVRGIHQELAAAMSTFHSNQVDTANFHLDNAIRCQPASTRTLHRSGTSQTPTRTTTSGTATPAGTDAVEVHIYNAPTSKALIPTHTLSTDQPIAAGSSADIDMRGNPVVQGATWQRQLRDAAQAANVTAVTVSGPRQVVPEDRVDHRRWSQAARQAAAAADPGAVGRPPSPPRRRRPADRRLGAAQPGTPPAGRRRRHVGAAPRPSRPHPPAANRFRTHAGPAAHKRPTTSAQDHAMSTSGAAASRQVIRPRPHPTRPHRPVP